MKTPFSLNKIARASLIASVGILAACSNDATTTPEANNALSKTEKIWPKLNIAVKQDPEIEAKIADYLKTMTLEQKVAQMIQPEIR
ncbi:MAG TPA: beta-glucosidase, partial [Pseudoalteromonas sp.]|nr:beta-glucosidase [Pseudoalteromonas sp.]